MKTILVTGGAGFIGSNFIRHMLESHDDIDIVNLDKLTYAGNLENLAGVETDPRYSFVRVDICDRPSVEKVVNERRVEDIVHFAAETHVDRSIVGPAVFVQTNVCGTQVLLDVAQASRIQRFVHVSTDEVYGSLGLEGKFTEHTPLHPNSPYAASKAASDMLALAYHHTFGTPVIITRCSNNYGPYQFPEKLVPLMITNALNDKPLPVYGDGMNVRDWIHVRDHCSALDLILHRGRVGEIYNIGANCELTNLELVKLLLAHLQKPESLISFVKDRPGHDRRYAIDASKVASDLQWLPQRTFARGLLETIAWYVEHEDWLQQVRSGEYQDYYKVMYEGR